MESSWFDLIYFFGKIYYSRCGVDFFFQIKKSDGVFCLCHRAVESSDFLKQTTWQLLVADMRYALKISSLLYKNFKKIKMYKKCTIRI